MLILVKENGSGLTTANSYASIADGDAYHEGHLYGSAWTGASTATKEAALVMATRVIDGCYQFNGFKVAADQALQWPRKQAFDADAGADFASDAIPAVLVNATCDLARELIKADTTDAVDGEGVSQLSIANSVFVQFAKKDSQEKVSPTAQLYLQKLGVYLGRQSGMVRLIRA